MIDDRLSEDIEVGAKMYPMYSTDITETDGGWEVRNSRWEYPLYRFEFDLMPNETDPSVITSFMNIFNAAGGSFETFLFTPFADYQGSNETLAALTGTTYQIVKNYTRGGVTRQRKITRPKTGTVVVYQNGALFADSNYSVNYETGVITFNADQSGNTITADFDFDVLVRFMDDELEILAHSGELLQPISVTLKQVKE